MPPVRSSPGMMSRKRGGRLGEGEDETMRVLILQKLGDYRHRSRNGLGFVYTGIK